jgi:hypothetical protein
MHRVPNNLLQDEILPQWQCILPQWPCIKADNKEVQDESSAFLWRCWHAAPGVR